MSARTGHPGSMAGQEWADVAAQLQPSTMPMHSPRWATKIPPMACPQKAVKWGQEGAERGILHEKSCHNKIILML